MAPKKNSAKKQTLVVPDSDHIVFGDDKKKKKSKGHVPDQSSSSEPPKPTARQVIGGASWTGKLPVNLLSEFCQRQKWDKPDYSMRQMPARGGDEKMFRSDVTLSKTDPKTREVTKLPTLRLPPSEAHIADQASALEARHFAATYALFRMQSMKNIHMTLPPNYRDLWKGDFARLKKQDVESGHGWKYDEDPFAAEAKRQDILKSIEKRKAEENRKLESQTDGKEVHQGSTPPARNDPHRKGWERAPLAVMGQQSRLDIEDIIRRCAVWNPQSFRPVKQQREQILENVARLGFRKSHIEEALDVCKDQQEVIEWLLVHIPEDDLPKWTFPPNYNAGVTLASGDLEKEGKLKRLASAGYPPVLCAQILKRHDGDERLAAFALQQILVPTSQQTNTMTPNSNSAWEQEADTLEAIFGENFVMHGKFQCSISMSTIEGQSYKVHFKCPTAGYPETAVPALSIEIANSPAYVRLSAIRRAVQYAMSDLRGEVMMYNICQWLETEIPVIMENPGRLSDLRVTMLDEVVAKDAPSSDKNSADDRKRDKAAVRRQMNGDVRSNETILEHWNTRQTTSAQIKMIAVRQRLPAWLKREDIVESIENRQFTIISGETGSGKSTQVVQFILDQAIQQLFGSRVNILCTQPRRVATLSLADRVSSERCSHVGDEVGYVIRGESKVSAKTKITFMTTGVLLRRLQSSASMKQALSNVSHVFIDEVHERSLDTDFLLALLKRCAREQPNLKIILMSATLDADIFCKYFGGTDHVALVNIEGRTFPVQDLYLEDAISFAKPGLSSAETGKAIQGLGFGINYDLIRDLVIRIDQELADQTGAILVFLPGTMEIERCLKAIAEDSKFLTLPLHASLLPAEQRRVFPPAPAGKRKVVAATNVAETSITIEDVVAVIDTGKVKETSYDVESNIVRLQEVWASVAACKQRRGRAGRVRKGTCYKLFTRNTEDKMASRNLPEIQRVPLEQLCLSVKATDPDCDVAAFLSSTLTPPSSGAVSNAIKALHVMNALDNNRLTALGTYLAMIPTDLRCAKLLVYGTLFDCLEPSLTIASILTVKSPFVSPRASREEANEARMNFSSSEGDLILDMRAYDQWNEYSQTSRRSQVAEWCSSHYISHQTMRDIASTRRQILDALKEAGLVPLDYRSPNHIDSTSPKSDQTFLLTALIAGSLQPQLAQIAFPSKKYIASMTGAKELDPEARTIKFFIPDEDPQVMLEKTTPTGTRSDTPQPKMPIVLNDNIPSQNTPMPVLSRVFVHPGSCLFSAQSFPRHSTHLSYFTKIMTTKPFIRDLTPLNVYSLLFFAGRLDLDTAGRGLTVAGVWKVQGWARIGVLISRLRVLLDEELKKVVEGGGVLLGSMSGSEVVHIIRHLLVLNGQDQ